MVTFSFAEKDALIEIASDLILIKAMEQLLTEQSVSGTDFVAVMSLFTQKQVLFVLSKAGCLSEYRTAKDAKKALKTFTSTQNEEKLPKQPLRKKMVEALLEEYRIMLQELQAEFEEKFKHPLHISDVQIMGVPGL